MKKFSLIALVALMAAACNGYDGPAPDSHLVLEGWIDSGGHPVVLLSESIPARNGSISRKEMVQSIARWGKVSVSDGEQEVVLTGMADDRYMPPYIFTSSKITGVPGREYTVTADYKDFHATATTTIPEPVPLDTLYTLPMSDSLYSIMCGFTDPPQKGNYYRAFTKTTGIDRKYQPSTLAYMSDEVFDGYAEMQIASTERLNERLYELNIKRGDEVSVKFCTCDRRTFLFWQNFEVMLGTNANATYYFDTDMYGGLQGALGYWAGYGASYYTITVE